MSEQIEMTAAEGSTSWTATMVKDKLRRRHPATQAMGSRTIPGPWTCVEELLGCDLVAFAAVRMPKNALGVPYARVGYEVKISRSDYRKELRSPHKREAAVGNTHAFYFAVPAGLLRPEELAVRQPFDDGEARLWVPSDVGLVEVTRGGCRVVHPSPTRYRAAPIDDAIFGVCARHISSHPDPRHDGVVAADRELSKNLREQDRAIKQRRADDIRRWEERTEAEERKHASSASTAKHRP